MTYEIDLTDISIDEHSKSLNIDGNTIPVKIIKMLLEKDEFFDVLFEYAKNGGTFKLAWKESQIIFSKRDRLFKCINFRSVLVR